MSNANARQDAPRDLTTEDILEYLLGPEGKVTGRSTPSWVLPRKRVNPVVLEQVPPHLIEAVEATNGKAGDKGRARFAALLPLVRYIYDTVYDAIAYGGADGVSASDLYWAWQDSGFGQFGEQGEVIGILSSVGLIEYDPTADADQQVVAVGEVVAIQWEGGMAFTGGERNYPGNA